MHFVADICLGTAAFESKQLFLRLCICKLSFHNKVCLSFRRWIAQCPTRLKRCPECRATTAIADIINIHANKIVVLHTDDDAAMREEFIELKRKMRNLKSMGIYYLECDICNMPFTSDLRRQNHVRERHNAIHM